MFGRPAGLRTHMIVCVASSLAMLVSIYGFSSGDPARLAAQVISGIGFIGAGTIIRGDKDITGITTASTIWICAIIGLSCGCGYYFGAIVTTILSLLILSCLTKVESSISKRRKFVSNLKIKVSDDSLIINKLKNLLSENNLTIKSLDYKTEILDDKNILSVNVCFEKHINNKELNNLLLGINKEIKPIECKLMNE
jgi:putative Mg2+ transporter-C (MgtC) family protein